MGTNSSCYYLQGLRLVKMYGFLKMIWVMHSSCLLSTNKVMDFHDGVLYWVGCVMPLEDVKGGC